MTTTMEQAAELSADEVREIQSFAARRGREMELLEAIGREDSPGYRELAADRAAAADTVHRSFTARQAREAESRRADAAARAEQQRREREHTADVEKAVTLLRRLLDGREPVLLEAIYAAAHDEQLVERIEDGDTPEGWRWSGGMTLVEAARSLAVVRVLPVKGVRGATLLDLDRSRPHWFLGDVRLLGGAWQRQGDDLI
jgi:hypothetical protein